MFRKPCANILILSSVSCNLYLFSPLLSIYFSEQSAHVWFSYTHILIITEFTHYGHILVLWPMGENCITNESMQRMWSIKLMMMMFICLFNDVYDQHLWYLPEAPLKKPGCPLSIFSNILFLKLLFFGVPARESSAYLLLKHTWNEMDSADSHVFFKQSKMKIFLLENQILHQHELLNNGE